MEHCEGLEHRNVAKQFLTHSRPLLTVVNQVSSSIGERETLSVLNGCKVFFCACRWSLIWRAKVGNFFIVPSWKRISQGLTCAAKSQIEVLTATYAVGAE